MGIPQLLKLQVFDLRKNLISKVEEIASVISVLPSLITIGLKGNLWLCHQKLLV